MAGDPETNPNPPSPGSPWDALVWPRWLPVPARLPLIAQIAGAAALIAAVAMPRWTAVPAGTVAESSQPAPAAVETPSPAPAPAPAPPRPAHLNLDVRHNLRSVDFSVSVDGKSVLETTLAGSGKRFGVIGKRAERGFTRTIEVAPGVRIVRVRVRSAADKFDQTRVERFDLESASVAALRIAAEKSGLTMVAVRPAAPRVAPVAQVAAATEAAAVGQASVMPQPPQLSQAALAAQAAQSAQEASALAELYRSLRSILIAMAGFIVSVASGFMFEEFLKSRNLSPFQSGRSPSPASNRRDRRRRARRPRHESDISIDTGLS